MSSQDDQTQSLGRERARLINGRLTELFQVRAKCERARALQGEIPQEHHLAFHNAIRDVYLALRPLSEDDAISDWWNSESPSRRWGEWERADPEHEASVPIGKDEDGEPVYAIWDPYDGVDKLDQLRDISHVERTEKEVFGGTKIETSQQPSPLPYDILLDVSMTLEDAANRLGFMPDAAESTPRTKITKDMVEEVEKWRQKKLE